MDDNFTHAVADMFAFYEDFNIKLIGALVEIVKALPSEARGPVSEKILELISEHKEGAKLFVDVIKVINGELPNEA